MNVVERKILEKALHYMNSKTADAIEQGIKGDEWEIANKHRALECMEILQLIDDCNRENIDAMTPKPLNPSSVIGVYDTETMRKLGRYKGVAGEDPKYE